MATNQLKLAFDRQARTLVPFNGSAASIKLYQGNVQDLQIQILDPPPGQFGPSATYTPQDYTGYTCAVTLSAQPVGSGVTPVAQNIALTFQSSTNGTNPALCFVGSLDLSPAAVTTLIGSNRSVQAWLEVDVRFGGVPQTIFQDTVTLFAVNTITSVGPPVGAAQYPTVQDMQAYAVPVAGVQGQFITLISPDGTKTGRLYWGNDNILHAE